MLSASQATFHPNQCHLCSCLLIYMLDSAGEMKSAANKSYSSALAKALIGAESPKSAKDSTPKPDCLESLPEMGISQLSDIPAAEVWDGNTATELSQNESRTSRESCPVHVFQTWAHRGLKSWLHALSAEPAPQCFSAGLQLIPNAIPALDSCHMGTGSVAADLSGFKTAAETQHAFCSSQHPN